MNFLDLTYTHVFLYFVNYLSFIKIYSHRIKHVKYKQETEVPKWSTTQIKARNFIYKEIVFNIFFCGL